MKSVMSPVVLDCPVSSPLAVTVCKWFQVCRNGLAGFAETCMYGMKRKSLPVEEQEDGFDWRLNEFVYEEEYSHSLPLRAWKRHSAMLVMAREMGMQSHATESHEIGVMQEQHGAM